MNKVLKLQRMGLQTPTVVEYKGKILATNQLNIEGSCNLWRCHFGFYPTEKVDLVMTKKQFSTIQQRTLSSVKSVYELFCEYNFIPRVFEPTEEPAEWGMYRKKEIEELKAENAALRARIDKFDDLHIHMGEAIYIINDNNEIIERFICGIHILATEIIFVTAITANYNPCDKKGVAAQGWHCIKNNLSLIPLRYFGERAFTDRAAAEKRLADEGKDD